MQDWAHEVLNTVKTISIHEHNLALSLMINYPDHAPVKLTLLSLLILLVQIRAVRHASLVFWTQRERESRPRLENTGTQLQSQSVQVSHSSSNMGVRSST